MNASTIAIASAAVAAREMVREIKLQN